MCINCEIIKQNNRNVKKKRAERKAQKQVKWHTNLASALAEAQKNKSQILLLATGSDWCPPCMNLEKKIISHKDFAKVVKANNLVLLKADFPRRREQSAQEKADAQAIVKVYPANGVPSVYLLDSQGKVLDKKTGFSGKSDSPESYLKSFKGFEKKSK